MASEPEPSFGSRIERCRQPPRAGWLALVALAALVAPPAASAHLRSGVIAVDYRASVFRLPASLRATIAVRIYASDLALGLTVGSGHTVVGLGYLGEPFVRVTRAGVAVNEASPTAAAVGLVKKTRPRVGTKPAWEPRSSGRTVLWHDARLRGLPPGVERARWTIPLLVDGRRARLTGKLWRVPAPSLWPWLVLGVPFVALAGIVLLSNSPLRRRALLGFGVAATASAIATATGFALDPYASPGKWVEGANELVFALVGLAFALRGSAVARPIAGGALGLLGLAVGLSSLPVFLHGVVLSVFPGTVARAALALAIWAGAAATVLGVVVFFELLETWEEPSAPHRQLGRGS